MKTDIAVILATLALVAVLALPRVAKFRLWRATITPLASIIGSGFLVLGPILDDAYGSYAPLAMALLCTGAWAFGAAIRFNMADGAEDGSSQSRFESRLDTGAQWTLAFAYVISVAYYLNLFGGFAVSLTPWAGDFGAHLVTTAVYAVILTVGWTRGFRWLEWMEYGSVTLKLAIIAGLIVGLVAYFDLRALKGELVFAAPALTGWPALTLLFGLIVTVQGFETSRYLGASYPRALRIRSMRLAQLVSTAIYMVYILLIAYVFPPDVTPLTETAIIDLMRLVSPLLPVMLVAAALCALFRAAVADTGGAGGLLAEVTGGRVTVRKGYALLGSLGVALTWSTDIFVIINYASRAFAAYYALQAMIAALRAVRRRSRLRAAGFGGLAALGLAIVIFGTPAAG